MLHETPNTTQIAHWSEVSVFANGISSDAVNFWVGILEYRNLLGNSPLRELRIMPLHV